MKNSSTTPTVLLQRIAQIQRMEPGKLCVMREGPSGPFYNLQYWGNGKSVTCYVPRDQAEIVAENIANYHNFRSLMEEYAQMVIARTRSERLEGAKKKPQRKTSLSPKTKRSNA